MYEAFFGFCRRPFSSAARLEDYFPSAGMERARQTLRACLERGAGWGVVIGAAGLGKTLLCQRLTQDLGKSFQTVLLSGGGITRRRELWQNLLYAVAQPYRGLEEGELRLALVEYLAAQQKQGPGFILLVDEAHLVAGKLLEEIRILTNLPGISAEWFRVMLAGTPELEERLSHPRLEALNQRIVARCYLEPWTRTETQAYIRTQLQKVSSKLSSAEVPISEQAIDAIFQATGGIPRLVNQLCDHVLLAASQQGIHVLDVRTVEEAWADLQQLPPPSAEAPQAGSQDSIIEYRVLDEEDFEASSGPLQGGPANPETSSSLPAHSDAQFSAERALCEQDSTNLDTLASQPGDSLTYRSPVKSGGANDSVLEAAENTGPEQELFFGPLQESTSEGDYPTAHASDDAGAVETERGPTSAWQRLEQIEQALLKIGDSVGTSRNTSEASAQSQVRTPGSDEVGLDGGIDVFVSETPVDWPSVQAEEKQKSLDVSAELSQKTDAQQSLPRSENKGFDSVVFGASAAFVQRGEEKHMLRELSEGEGKASVFRGSVCAAVSSGGIADRLEGPCQPEVELVFGSAASSASPVEASGMEKNPFAESFLEEEWIEDPYLSLSMEGQRPWSPTTAFLQKDGTNSGDTDGGYTSRFASFRASEGNSKGIESSPSFPPEKRIEEPASPGGDLSLGQNISQPSGQWEANEKATGSKELPLIVIEEDWEEPSPVVKSTAVAVPRYEYRRLFARLRRG